MVDPGDGVGLTPSVLQRPAEIERATGTTVYFASPHHPWQRGTNENTNGLIRQYLPKGKSMANLTQKQCDAIAQKLNTRPRKRYDYETPTQRIRA